MTFSYTDADRLSPALYAEAFCVPEGEAEADLATLTAGGALPLTLSEGEDLLTQGLALPMTAEGYRILYLYALVTAPRARGQGHLRTLLGRSAEMARAAGYAALALLPATPALAEAYRRMGFTESRPAGGAAHIGGKEDLTYRIPPQGAVPADRAELYRALGGALSPTLFDFAVDTLAPTVLPFKTEGGVALLLARDTRFALTLPTGMASVCHREEAHRILLAPLGGGLPSAIPEPLPR